MLATLHQGVVDWVHVLSAALVSDKVISRYIHRRVVDSESEVVPSVLDLGIHAVGDRQILVNPRHCCVVCVVVKERLQEHSLQVGVPVVVIHVVGGR